MNFFTCGYVLLALQLNYSWVCAYALKIVGMLFVMGGIAEMNGFTKGFSKLKGSAALSGAAFVICTAVIGAAKLLGASGTVFDICSLAAGAAGVAFSYFIVRKILTEIDKHNELINDVSNLKRVQESFDKLSAAAMLSIPFDAVYRFFSDTAVGSAAEIASLALRIAAICMVISSGLNFNRMRNDFNSKHSADI